MAVVFVQKSAELFADNAASIAPSLSGVTSGNHVTLLVALSVNGASTAISAPSGWSTAQNPSAAGALAYRPTVGIFYKENAAGGTEAATVAFTSGSYASASIIEISGLKTSASLAASNNASGTSGTAGGSGSASNTVADAVVFAIGHPEDGAGLTTAMSSPAASGYSAIDTEATNSLHIAYDFSYKIVSATASQSASWTWTTSGPFVNAIAVFDAVPPGPTITAQPINQRVPAGTAASFSVSATGTGSLTYQWQSNVSGTFADISGETATTYTTASLSAGVAYAVRCVVTDTIASTNSDPADVWTPAADPAPWAGILMRSGGRDFVRTALTIPQSGDALKVYESALWGVAAAGGSGSVGLATETDTAFALAAVQVRAAGLASETDTALALSPGANAAVGLASETDVALALAAVQLRAAGLAAETDAAFALAGLQSRATGLSTEADTGLALAGVQRRAVGLASETDTALALAPGANGAVGLASETDTALALAAVQRLAAGLSSEVDTAFALGAAQARAVGVALESDASFSLAALQRQSVGLATETDEAFALDVGGSVAIPVGLAVEIDTAFALQPGVDEVLESAGGRLGWVERGPFVRRTFATRGAAVAYSLAPRILPGAPKPREAVTVRAPLVHAGRLPSAVARKPPDLRLIRSPKPALIRSADLIT